MSNLKTVAMNVTIKSKTARCMVVPGLPTSLVNNLFVFSILEPIEATEWPVVQNPYEGPLGSKLFVMGTVTLSYKTDSKVGVEKFLVVGNKNFEEPLLYDVAIGSDRIFPAGIGESNMGVQPMPQGVSVSLSVFEKVVAEMEEYPGEGESGSDGENDENACKRRRIR